MDIFTIFFIFMITTSITLTGFVIRQRKNNRMLGELVAQTKVENIDRYSNLGVGTQNKEFVSKCPACAEWINLDAKVCKSCQNNVENHNRDLREAMQKIDESIVEADLARAAHNKAQLQALRRSPLFRKSLALCLVIAVILIGIQIPSTLSYYKATSNPENSSTLVNSWNSIVEECQFLGTVQRPKAYDDDYGTVKISIQLGQPLNEFDWSTRLGKEIICFSEKALAIDVSKKLDPNRTNNINLRNSFAIFGDYETRYISFYWN